MAVEAEAPEPVVVASVCGESLVLDKIRASARPGRLFLSFSYGRGPVLRRDLILTVVSIATRLSLGKPSTRRIHASGVPCFPSTQPFDVPAEKRPRGKMPAFMLQAREWRETVGQSGMTPTAFAFLVPVFVVAIATPLYVHHFHPL